MLAIHDPITLVVALDKNVRTKIFRSLLIFFHFSVKLKVNFIWMMVKHMIIDKNVNIFIVILHLKIMNFNQRRYISFYLNIQLLIELFFFLFSIDLWI